MDILAGLNSSQRAAAECIAGPLLILAGPGSGKTRVITHRIAYLINVCGVRPYNILAVTFTNKAAREMKERLKALAPADVDHLTVGTFHAICARILRREASAIGLDSRFVIYDDDDQLNLIRGVLKELNLDEKAYQPRAIQSHISAAKSELRSPVQYAEYATSYFEEIVLRVYRRYQEMLAENKGLDFDDLLMTTVRLFRERPDVLEKYQSRYAHLLVDEFQDTNVAQYVLVKMLGDKHRNVCVVGDEDQSIYSWRQADIRNILNFEYDFPGVKTIYLEQNYRSTKTILNAASSVIAANTMRKDKHLWTENDQGLPVVVFEAYNEEEEANYVVSEIERLISSGRNRPGDCAVMYRANAQSRVLERAFLRRRMPHKIVGTRFYQRKETKDVIAYLRVISNPQDAVSFNRIINVPTRGLGNRTLTELDRWAHQLGVSAWDALLVLRGDQVDGVDAADGVVASSPFNARTERLLLDALSVFEGFIEASRQLPLPDLIKLVLARSGYADSLKDGTSEGEERLQNVNELLTVADEYAQLEPEVGLLAFLEEVALATDVDEYDESENAVTLITLHGAKGLEFPVVFIVGMEEGVCPHVRSFDDSARMEEERRLCYVGMTRAKERLYLVYAFRRTLYGTTNVNTPSRFLADIPRHLVKGWEKKASATKSRGSSNSVSSASYTSQGQVHVGHVRASDEAVKEAQKPKRALPAEPAFKPGDRVKHPKFGDGIVINVSVLSDDHEVSVAFPEIGVKRLSLSFAPLEKV